MTENQQVLKFLHDWGEKTVLQMVDGTDIPASRAHAALEAHVRAGRAVKVHRDGFARYTITEAGTEHVKSLLLVRRAPALRRRDRRA